MAADLAFLRDRGANIVQSDQHSTDPEGGAFFMRTEFHLDGARGPGDAFEAALRRRGRRAVRHGVADAYAAHRKRVAILVSRYDHCLVELLWRHRRGELYADIPLVVSNHADLGATSRASACPSSTSRSRDAKPEAERALLELLGRRFDLIVLARYMQILSATSSPRRGRRSSTSTTRSCRPSPAPTRTRAPTSAG